MAYVKKKEVSLSFIDDLEEELQDQVDNPQDTTDLNTDLPIPDIETFLYDEDYLHLPFRISDVQLNFLKALDDDVTDSDTSKYSQLCCIWGKGCISGDSIIDGYDKRIEELAAEGKPLEVLSYNETIGKIEKVQCTEPPFLDGMDYTLFEVELEDGKKITVTPEHIFYNENGEIMLKDLSVGDSLMVLGEEKQKNMKTKLVKIKKITYKGTGKFYSMNVPDADPTKGNHNYFANGILNHNGGKDFIAGVGALRVINKLLCYKDPRETLRRSSGGKISIAPSDYIDILNIAVNAEQAKSVYFDKLCGLVKNAGYKAFKRFGFDYSKNVTASTIVFPKELRIISGNSKQESLEGKNLIMATLDEIAAFKTKDELKGTKGQLSAEDMFDVLRTSINTRFPVFGKLVMISYPRHKKDFLMQYYDEAVELLKDNPDLGIYLSKAATWEANPTKSKEDKAIADDYIKNPEKAAQFYECIAPDSEDPFFKMKDKIHRMYETMEVLTPFNPLGGYSPSFKSKPYYYVVHIDLAYASDRASLALSHVEGEGENRVFYVDLIKYWEAEPEGEIDLSLVEQEILFLRNRGFNIIDTSYDNASLSKYLIQRLEKNGFNTSYITVDRNIAPYNSLKDLIYSEKVKTYYNSILIEEMLGLSLINGNKIDHVNAGIGKDLVDSLCGSVYNLLIKKISAQKRWTRAL